MVERDYQSLYEQHAQKFAGSEAIGDGDFDAIGRGELDVLRKYGLEPHHALLDFGCGIGRLAQFAIPYLSTGQYSGIDISPTMIQRAMETCSASTTSCKVNWIVQTDEHFDFADDSFDMVCAFSVFTHMEHEDAFRYLKTALRIVKPGGLFLFTCLPVDRYKGEQVFLGSASMTLAERWSQVRNVTTTMDMMFSISRLAGWHVTAWEPEAVGQSLCVLRKPEGTESPALLLPVPTGNPTEQTAALRLQLAERDRQLQALQTQMDAITHSTTWNVLQTLGRARLRLAPRGSRREAALRLVKRGLSVWRREGFVTFVRRAFGLTRRSQKKNPSAGRLFSAASRRKKPGPLPLELITNAPPGRHRATVDIIVCVHNALADVQQCLESIVRYTHPPYTLVLVDDGSEPDTQAYLEGFAFSQGARLVRNEQAKGYTFAANQGLAQSTADYAVLLNSDTVVTLNWLDRLIGCAESDPRIGLVGPLSNSATWQSIPDVFRPDGDWAENKMPEDCLVAEMGTLVERYSGRLYPRPHFLNGFCLMIKRQVIQQIGHFDEDAFGKGYGEENDYCLRARKAGWQLAIADDAFIYHAQSRSYSHARRKQLTEHTDRALVAKHGQQMILDGIDVCRYDRVLEGIRARARVMPERERFIREGKERWEGKRVLFLLPLLQPTGGGYIVFQEARAMIKMGVDVRLLNLAANRQVFERSHPDLQIPAIYWQGEGDGANLGVSFDGVLATAYNSVPWLRCFDRRDRPARGYYIQDFEPFYFEKGSDDFQKAWNSYTLFDDLIRIAKTEWDRATIKEQIGVESRVGGPTVDIDLCRPRRRQDPDWPQRPLRVAAMIRPFTPWRGPEMTMRVLKRLADAHARDVEIILFGCRSNDPAFLRLPRDFAWQNAGILTRSQVAALMNEIDIFADLSVFQAQGLTAMEAMACGAAVVVPENGGAKTFVRHEENGMIVDSHSAEACLAALERLVTDQALRVRLQRQALFDVCCYFPERGAYYTLEALFHGAGAGP